MFNKVLLLILTLTFSSLAHAKTVEIEMLNKLGKEKMLYSVKVAEVDVNDKIIWKSTTKGHNVEFVVMPKGVKKFKSKINKDATYEFKVPGIYLYQCTPHKAMGMIGIVVVGNDKSNLDAVKKAKMRGKSKKVLKELLKGI
jgi:pseudoazurin